MDATKEKTGPMTTILIVDDDADMQNYFRFILSRRDRELLRAENGREALSILDQRGNVDLILLDIIMPVMDGEEFFRVLRQERQSPIPVILCSVDEKRARNLQVIGDVQGIFPKGHGREELATLIDRFGATP